MTNEERDLISRFVARVGGAASGGFSSVPAAQTALPPVDREADQYIAEQFQSHPEARYRVTQMAVVQEAALAEASNRIQRLQWELQQAQKAAQENAQAAQQQPQQSRGFLGGLFGGGQPAQQPSGPWNQGQGAPYQSAYAPQGFQASSPPPQPQYPPNMQPGMFQQGGSGFLGSALTTAAGVAGGMVAGNALMGLFSGHSGGGFGGGGFGGGYGGGEMMPPNETIINNNYGDASGGDSAGGGGAPEFDQNTSYDSSQDGGGFDNSGGFDSGGGGFDDNNA